MNSRAPYYGTYSGPADYSVEPDGEAFKIVGTRWYRFRDEKDFDDWQVEGGLSREEAEAKAADCNARAQMKPCDHPKRNDAYIMMFALEDRTPNQMRDAARLVKAWEWQCQMGYYYRTASMLLRRLGEREG